MEIQEIEKDWIDNKCEIYRLMLQDDIANFTNWRVIRWTMFYIPRVSALNYLQSLSDWDKWKRAIIECPVGNPEPYKFYPQSSGNLITQATHLAHFLSKTSCKLENLKTIIEFGAGYGCMCRLIHKLGFSGKYIIMDLPELLELQKYYLTSTLPSQLENILLLSNETEFVEQISKKEGENLFIATWSLSEAPYSLRNRILQAVCKETDYILLAYQARHRDFDNASFFSEFRKNNANYRWDLFNVPHLLYRQHYYLFGERK